MNLNVIGGQHQKWYKHPLKNAIEVPGAILFSPLLFSVYILVWPSTGFPQSGKRTPTFPGIAFFQSMEKCSA